VRFRSIGQDLKRSQGRGYLLFFFTFTLIFTLSAWFFWLTSAAGQLALAAAQCQVANYLCFMAN